MHDWLEELVGETHLAHPSKASPLRAKARRVKAIAKARIKTDKIDSKKWETNGRLVKSPQKGSKINIECTGLKSTVHSWEGK